MKLVTYVWPTCKKDVNPPSMAKSTPPLRLRREAVPDPGVRVDEAAAGKGSAELRSKATDIDVNRAIALLIRAPPDRLVQLRPSHHPLSVVREFGQQLELADGQEERPAIHQRRMIGGGELEPAGVDGGLVLSDDGERRSGNRATILTFHGIAASPLAQRK